MEGVQCSRLAQEPWTIHERSELQRKEWSTDSWLARAFSSSLFLFPIEKEKTGRREQGRSKKTKHILFLSFLLLGFHYSSLELSQEKTFVTEKNGTKICMSGKGILVPILLLKVFSGELRRDLSFGILFIWKLHQIHFVFLLILLGY